MKVNFKLSHSKKFLILILSPNQKLSISWAANHQPEWVILWETFLSKFTCILQHNIWWWQLTIYLVATCPKTFWIFWNNLTLGISFQTKNGPVYEARNDVWSKFATFFNCYLISRSFNFYQGKLEWRGRIFSYFHMFLMTSSDSSQRSP